MQSFFTFAVLQDYTSGVAFDDCVPQFCRGLSTDAKSRTPLVRFLRRIAPMESDFNGLDLPYTTQILQARQGQAAPPQGLIWVYCT
jgi:hypothetical protein